MTAAHAALAILAMISASVLGLAVRNRIAGDSMVPSVVTGFPACLPSVARARWRGGGRIARPVDGFAWLSVPLLAVSLGAGAPGALGAAHLFITALAAGVLTCGVAVMTRRHINVAATIVTLCGLGGVIAAARMWRPVPAQWLGMCTLVILLFLLTLAPTIALWAARIRPPYFGSVTGRDLFRRSAGLPVDAVSPVDEAAEEELSPDTTPRGAQIAAAAVRANNVLTGICVVRG